MRRFPASIVSATYVVPGIDSTTGLYKGSGIWTHPEILNYRNSGTWFPSVTVSNTASAVSATDLTNYTFSAQALGTAATGRWIVVGVGGVQVSGRTVSSLTVGGVSATQISHAAVGAFPVMDIWIAYVPTGTTGDVVVNFSAGMLSCSIGVWRLLNICSSTAAVTANSLYPTDPFSSALAIPQGAVVVGYSTASTASVVPTFTWTELTENFDATVEAGTLVGHTGASKAYDAGSTPTITCAGSVAYNGGGMVLAAFR